MATPVYVADSNEMPDRQESRGAPREGNRKHTYIMALSANDVLCGRGSGPNDHEGNIRFRQLVLSRKAEYLSTNARQTKSRIAQEIVYHVKFRVNPQGRFLKKLEADTLQCSGFAIGTDVWCVVSEETALEKAKQALRQNRDRHLVEAQIKMHQASLQRKQHLPTPPETDVASFDSAPTSGAGTPVLSHRPPPLSQTIDDEKLTAAMFPPAYGITAPLAPVPPLSYCPLPPDLDRPMEPPKVKPPHQPQTQHPPSQSQAHGANSLFYTENAHPMYHAGGTVSDAVLMPSPPSRSSGDRESIRESLTVDDLEKDFAQIRAQRNYQKGLLARLNQQDLDRQRHQDLLLRQHQLNERREQQFHERSMASPENRFAGQEQFPYALGARGPSAKSVPSINPIPVGQAGSSVRLSSNNMEYIVSALNDSDEVQQDKLDSSDDRQKQFMNEQKHRVGMAASTAGDEVVDLGVHRRSVTSVGSEYSFRRSGISAMSGLSDMSLSLSNMNIQGLNGGISSIKEGKKEDLSEADLEGSGTLYGEESTQMEPRCISNIRTNPDMHLFGSSSLSLMKGLNGDSSSTFSGLSAVMNAFSGCDEETRIESLSSSGSSKSKSLSRN